MKRFGVLSAALLAACGSSSSSSVNSPPLTTFTYSAPQPVVTGSVQATSANNASTSVGQIVVSTSPNNPTGAAAAPTLAESLGLQVLAATAQKNPGSPAAQATANLVQKTRSGELDTNCYNVSGNTLSYNNCSITSQGYTVTANGSLTATASNITWNLTFTESGSGTSGTVNVTYDSSGNINYTPTSISGSCQEGFSGSASYNGQNESFAFTIGIDFINITISDTCDGSGGIVSGTLEIRANSTGANNPFGFTQKGVEFIWSQCDQVSVATST